MRKILLQRVVIKGAITLLSTQLLIGCGSSSSVDEVIASVLQKGFLTNPAVVGIDYECGDIKGTTLDKGEFACKTAPITFKLGELTLGTLKAFTADNKVFLQDLVGVKRDNFTDADLKKLAQLLQSLDDGSLPKGLNIPKNLADRFIGADADLDKAIEDLAAMAGLTEWVNAEDAIAFLQGDSSPENPDTSGNTDNKLTTLLAGKTLYLAIDDKKNTLESLAFNKAMTQMTYKELVGGKEGGSGTVSGINDMTFVFMGGDGGKTTVTVTAVTDDYVLLSEDGGTSARAYFDESKARAYFFEAVPDTSKKLVFDDAFVQTRNTIDERYLVIKCEDQGLEYNGRDYDDVAVYEKGSPFEETDEELANMSMNISVKNGRVTLATTAGFRMIYEVFKTYENYSSVKMVASIGGRTGIAEWSYWYNKPLANTKLRTVFSGVDGTQVTYQGVCGQQSLQNHIKGDYIYKD